MVAAPPSDRRPARAAGSRGGILTVLVVAVVVVVAAVGAFWWFFWRTDAQPEPALHPTRTVAGGTLAGTWNVDQLLGTFVQYRVKEQLAGAIVQTDATGRTSEVTGKLVIAGSTVTSAAFTADMRTLQSDKQRRDEKMATDGLQTDQYPTARFVLTDPVPLGTAPRKGERIHADARGDLTLHGVTRHVVIPLEGLWNGDSIQVIGKLPIQFSDYGITPPNIGGFVTVADKGRMELQLNLSKR